MRPLMLVPTEADVNELTSVLRWEKAPCLGLSTMVVLESANVGGVYGAPL